MPKSIAFAFCASILLVVAQARFAYCQNISSGAVKSSDSNLLAAKARDLERIKGSIDYCLVNVGKKFSELDEKKAGTFWPYNLSISVLTYMVIADKYDAYGDMGKAGDYYYLNWLHYNTPQTDATRWPWPTGESDDPFLAAIGSWEYAGRYTELAAHYKDYIIYRYSPRKVGPKEEQIKEMKKALKFGDKDMRLRYESNLKKLEEYKKLAKTEKPKPLDPAVQNHEWFYSDKQEEVLKALEYYHANKVNFMLEKALKHKNSVIAVKAKEYLESLTKGAGDEPKH